MAVSTSTQQPRLFPRAVPATSLYASTPATLALNLGSLVLLSWGVASQAHVGSSGRHLAATVLLALAVASWLYWAFSRNTAQRRPTLAALSAMAIAGGGAVAFASLADVFLGVAALGAATQWPADRAVIISALGWAAMATSLALTGNPAGWAVGAVAATFAGLLMGMGRRQSNEQAAQRALLQFEKERAEVEAERARLLDQRNHLAREIHDVLAHTLSALAVQLEALDSVLHEGSAPSENVDRQVERSRRLVREGLDEARRAVHALRSAPTPLLDQMAGLAEVDGVTLSVSGQARPLPADVSTTLYRAAQEGLANVVKHAPGAPAQVSLDYEPGTVSLTVTNPSGTRTDSLAAGSGGGYGLQGMRERVTALGGQVEAGPWGQGWRLEVQVPA